MIEIKASKKYSVLFVLITIFISGILPIYASGSKSACVGQLLIINYSSSNVSSCSAISTPAGYTSIVPGTNTSSSYNPGNANFTSGVFSISCSNGVTGVTDNTTLNVDTTRFWHVASTACQAPRVVGPIIVTGQYYQPLGNVRFTCEYSTGYIIRRATPLTGTIISQGNYTGPSTYIANILPDTTETFYLQCRDNASGVLSTPSEPFTFRGINYRTTTYPVPPAMSITASPRTISKGQKTTLTWNATFPSSSCTLTSKAVCVNNQCTALQLAASTTINTKIASESTDTNDPNTSRLILTSIKNVAPGRKDTDVPTTIIDWKAFGKKTFTIDTTTDFTYTCGTAPTKKSVTARVLVTKSTEQ